MVKPLPDQKNLRNGQVLLIILLVVTVVLTIGISVASRSITDVKISQQSSESGRAFWVAQAGLEKAIKANAASSGSLNSVDYTVSKTGLGGGADFVFPEKILANEPITLWLVFHNESTGEIEIGSPFKDRLTLFWGNEAESASSPTTPALEATLIYSAGGIFRNKRFTYDPYQTRPSATNFSSAQAGGAVLGQNLSFSSGEINLKNVLKGSEIPYLFRLKLLFSSTPQLVAVKAASSLPTQGSCYYSSATVPESGVTRKLSVCRLWPVPPSIFDYTLFSQGGINQ